MPLAGFFSFSILYLYFVLIVLPLPILYLYFVLIVLPLPILYLYFVLIVLPLPSVLTVQHTQHKRPYPRRDSNPQSQQAIGRRLSP